MLIKFFNRGTGSGKGTVNYLTRKDDPITKKLREPAPEVLRFGNPSLTADLIDSLRFQHKYRSGVLSFAPEDAPSEKEQQKLIDDFEAIAFAGIEDDNRNILWVRHQHTGSNRIELHFLTPRVELSTGKSLNIAPPGWRSYFQPWQDKWNLKSGWADPGDPSRARVSSPVHTAFEAKRKTIKGEKLPSDTRSRATATVELAIALCQASDREGVVKALKDGGFKILRATKKSITIANQDWTGDPKSSRAKVRLKSQVFYSDWSRANQLNPPIVSNAEKSAKLLELEAELQEKVAKRKSFNQEKYPKPENQSQSQPHPKDYLTLDDFMEANDGDRTIGSKKNNYPAIARKQELQQLKQDINLVEFAIAHGSDLAKMLLAAVPIAFG